MATQRGTPQGTSRSAVTRRASSPLPGGRSHRRRAGGGASGRAPQSALAAAPRRMTSAEAEQPCGARGANAHDPGPLRHVTGEGGELGGAGVGGPRGALGRGALLPRGKVQEVSRLGFSGPKSCVFELVSRAHCPLKTTVYSKRSLGRWASPGKPV